MTSLPTQIKIVNVVATASLDRSVDMKSLAIRFPYNVSYDPKVYFAAYFKSKEMRGKVSIFSSGKMIGVGTKSEENAKRELTLVAMALQEAGIAKLKETPRIQNIVAVADLGFKPDLEALMERVKAIYEPEQFPGMIIRLPGSPSATILLFSSGKIVCVGLKNHADIHPLLTALIGLVRGNDQCS